MNNYIQDELSSAKLSSLSWGWVELRLSWSWNWVETELGKYLNSSIEVFKVFNWSIWSLVPFYYFPGGWVAGWLGGWVAGWVAGIAGNKAISASKLKLKLSWVELSWGWAWQKISNCINLLSPAPTYQALTRKFFQDMSEEKFEQKQPKRSEAKGCKILCCNNENINQVLKCQDLH